MTMIVTLMSVMGCRAQGSRYDPLPSGDVLFFENFQHGLGDRWVKSENPEFTGQWSVGEVDGAVAKDGLPGEHGLVVGSVAHKHAISAAIQPPVESLEGEDFVFQFEVRFQRFVECGGAYLKLLRGTDASPLSFEPGAFDNTSPYAIMFGPDRCGSDNKLHFIFQRRSPVTGLWEEKALRPFPPIPIDTASHLYTLHLRTSSSSFEVLVDGLSHAEGSLYEHFEPPVNPPAQIDDPRHAKPSDWVDDPLMADPDAVRPADWDEDAPQLIDDPAHAKPADWDEAQPLLVADPAAACPADWDEELDGLWEAPLVANPVCATRGCGPWQPRQIANPDYRGPWSAPLVANPDYRGPWRPRRVPNPEHYEDPAPARFPPIVGVGIELWTMTDLITFDNIMLTRSRAVADEFAQRTWRVKHDREQALADAAKPAEAQGSSDFFEALVASLEQISIGLAADPAAAFALTSGVVIVPILIIVLCCLRPATATHAPTSARRRPHQPSPTAAPAPAVQTSGGSQRPKVE